MAWRGHPIYLFDSFDDFNECVTHVPLTYIAIEWRIAETLLVCYTLMYLKVKMNIFKSTFFAEFSVFVFVELFSTHFIGVTNILLCSKPFLRICSYSYTLVTHAHKHLMNQIECWYLFSFSWSHLEYTCNWHKCWHWFNLYIMHRTIISCKFRLLSCDNPKFCIHCPYPHDICYIYIL